MVFCFQPSHTFELILAFVLPAWVFKFIAVISGSLNNLLMKPLLIDGLYYWQGKGFKSLSGFDEAKFC